MEEFDALLELGAGGVSLIRVPADIVARLGAGQRPKVFATLNEHTYRTTIAIYSGQPYLGVRREVREAAGLPEGGPLRVRLALDTEPRLVDLPADLTAALAPHPELRRTYEGLSYTSRKEIAESLTTARRESTRARRLEQIVARLKAST